MSFLDCRGETQGSEQGPAARLAPRLPHPRGRLSAALFGALTERDPLPVLPEAESEEDAQVALWALYELHYRGLAGVDAEREWDPEVLTVRRSLERDFERSLRETVPVPAVEPDVIDQLRRLIAEHDGPSVARFVQREAHREQVEEILQHRSIYHLKEADPTSWAIPRLPVAAKAALVEIQYDEYGGGDPSRLHHHLFAEGMLAAGLDAAYGAYIDQAPVEVLAVNNALSLFGLHRRLTGAALGHFAAFEATSSLPSRQMAQGLRRLGFPETTAAYYDEHVEADAVHEQLALRHVCGPFVEQAPEQAGQVLFGALVCLELEARYARRILDLRQAA